MVMCSPVQSNTTSVETALSSREKGRSDGPLSLNSSASVSQFDYVEEVVKVTMKRASGCSNL